MSGEGTRRGISLPFFFVFTRPPWSSHRLCMMLQYLIFFSVSMIRASKKTSWISATGNGYVCVCGVCVCVCVCVCPSAGQTAADKHSHACIWTDTYTHTHTQDSFQRSLLFLLLPFPFSGLPTFPECPGCAVKEPCLLCAPGSPNPALFCPDSWFSLSLSLSLSLSFSLSLFNIHSKSLGSHKTAVFPVFLPPLTAKCGPCECKHARREGHLLTNISEDVPPCPVSFILHLAPKLNC